MHHQCRQTLPSQSIQIRPLLPLFTSTLHIQSTICVSTLQPEPSVLTSSLFNRGHHVPLQMSIMSTASSSCCLWSYGFPSHQGENPKALLCPGPGHLLDLISYCSLFCSPCSNHVSLAAGPGTSQSFPLSRCFVLLSPPYSSFWGKSLWGLYIILISVESGLSSNLNFSETLF